MQSNFILWPDGKVILVGEFPTEHIKIGENIFFIDNTDSLEGKPVFYLVKNIINRMTLQVPLEKVTPKPELLRCLYLEPV